MTAVTTSPDTTVEAAPADVDPRQRWWPDTSGLVARAVALAGIAALAVVVPLLVPSTLVNVVSKAIVFGVVALSMNILIGYAGQVSLGHQAFVGVGAFTSAFLLDKAALPWPIAVVGSVALGAFISLGLGAVALRVKGLYFALVTIAYGVFVQATVFNVPALTGGGAGANAPRPTFATGDIAYAYVCLAALLVAWAFDWRLTASRAGRAIAALRDDERVAASWGINVTGFKLLAFALSGAVAGLAGALFASIEQIVSPITFGLPLALTFVLMTVVGGLRSRPGVVIGGVVFAVLPTLLEAAHGAWGEGEATCTTLPPDLVQFVLGVVLVAGVGERVVHAVRTSGWTGRTVAATTGAVAFGAFVLWTFALGGFTGGYCFWATIDALWEPLIGALLLILTLTQFPGGIAEQFAPVFNWLRFRPFESDAAAGSSAATSGGSDARP